VTAATIPIEDLSPGAALRPILQQAALPCTAYVGGPGELAYHRFITPVYAALGVAQPELIPRVSLTLVPGWCARALAGHGITAETADHLRAPAPVGEARLAPLDAVIANLAADPALAGSARRLARERAHLARRLQRLAERRAGRMPVGSLRAYLSPRGARQERTMSLIQALWEHGPGLAQILVAQAATCAPGAHRFIAL
jgi:bacillithiol synthase